MLFDVRRLPRLGAIANVVVALGIATAWAYSRPLFGAGGDEAAHLDYAYQVWKGQLPIFENGLLFQQTFGARPPVQWTAQHPPLFYLIQAPFVGPWIDGGHLLLGGYVGRAVNAVIAAALVAAVMWAASAIAPGRDALWLAAGTVTALYPLVVEIGGIVYNDNFFALWATLLVGLTARILRRGPSRQRLILFALVAAAALLTRAAAAPVIAVCATTLGVALLIRRPRSWPAIAGLVAAVAFAIATSAWFYLRNQQLTGNLLGGHFDYLTHRVRRTLPEVITRVEVWDQLLAIHGYDMINHVLATLLLFGLPLVAACVLGIRHLLQHRQLIPDVALAVLLTGMVATVVLMQLNYVSAGGGASKRYLGPITVIVAFAIAAAITAARRLAPLLLSIWVALEFVPLAGYILAGLGAPARANVAPVFPAPTILAVLITAVALVATLGVQFVIAQPSNGAPSTRQALPRRTLVPH